MRVKETIARKSTYTMILAVSFFIAVLLFSDWFGVTFVGGIGELFRLFLLFLLLTSLSSVLTWAMFRGSTE